MSLLKRHAVAVLFVLAVMITGRVGSARAEDRIVFGAVWDSRPLAYEQGGTVKGFLPDVFQRISARAGYDIAIKPYPVKRLESLLETGAIDGTVFIIPSKKRDAFLIYSPTPIMVSRVLVFIKAGHRFEFEGVDDLFGHTLGTVLGWQTLPPPLKKAVQDGRIQIEPAPGHRQNLKKLMTDRVDGIIGTEQITSYHINKLGLAGQIVALPVAISQIRAFFAISRTSKRIKVPEKFMAEMNTALESIRLDGTYDRGLNEYNLVLPQSL